ncbi:MAG: SDR family NAD(P)-dependent oxidoreductase, partial [Candidatus Dormibacteraeota bacterium]|nr:SDR family NAD(P)-dependent oxidoreductase [Candidatus Dormibacteraeota bacterium]
GALRHEGMEVVIGDVEDGALREAAGSLGAYGVRTDVSDAASVEALAQAATDRFGAVHVVCNNAGVGPWARIADLTLDDWRWIVGVNLWGVIHGVHTFLPRLEANPDGGFIVNTASLAGLRPTKELGSYVVTKYGVVGLTETLALELEESDSRVGVSVLCPGPIHTNIGSSSRNRPPALGEVGVADVRLEDSPLTRRGQDFLEPDDAGAVVVDAIKTGRLYALTHPWALPSIEERFDGIVRAFREAQQARGVRPG